MRAHSIALKAYRDCASETKIQRGKKKETRGEGTMTTGSIGKKKESIDRSGPERAAQ